MNAANRLVFFILLIATVSCGKSPSEKNDLNQNLDLLLAQGLTPDGDGTFLAVLGGVNKNIIVPAGALTLAKDGDFFVADVRVSHSTPNVIHAQNIHLGKVCPTSEADLNHDGMIDIMEAERVVGPMIMPLDGDISTQLGDFDAYPETDPWGAYVYSRTASFNVLLEDLNAEDDDPIDNIEKLSTTGLKELHGRVVLIQGVAPDLELPTSVASLPGLTAQETLPVACGVLKVVTHVPGIFEPDDMTVGRIPDNNPGRPDSVNPHRPERGRPGYNTPGGRRALKPESNGARRRGEPKTTQVSRGQ